MNKIIINDYTSLLERNYNLEKSIEFANGVIDILKRKNPNDFKFSKEKIEILNIIPSIIFINPEVFYMHGGAGYDTKNHNIYINASTNVSWWVDNPNIERKKLILNTLLSDNWALEDIFKYLVHEYTHYSDDIKSKYKIFNKTDAWQSKLEKNPEYNFKKEYYNSFSEINAHFNAFLINKKECLSKPFSSFMRYLKLDEWYQYLTQKNKNTIVSRLYSYWKKNKIDTLIDNEEDVDDENYIPF